MTVRHVARVCVLTLLSAVVLVACGKKPPKLPPPPPTKEATAKPPAENKAELVRLTVTAAADVNPDPNGRPSPVVVRVYQLGNDTKFNAIDLVELLDDESKLGADLLEKSFEVTLRPNETVSPPNYFVNGHAYFIGVVAAYRDYRNANAQWRIVVPRAVPVQKSLSVSVGKLRVELTAK